MIQNLIQAIATLLQNNLANVTIQSTTVDTPPTTEQLPVLALYPTKLLVTPGFRERPAEQSPHPLPAAQLVALSQKRGPYPLDHTPLPGTLLAQTVPSAGDAAQPLA